MKTSTMAILIKKVIIQRNLWKTALLANKVVQNQTLRITPPGFNLKAKASLKWSALWNHTRMSILKRTIGKNK